MYSKKQRYTIYLIWTLLCMFPVAPQPIIRSANHCIYNIWYLSHLPLSWKSWNWFECARHHHHPSSGAQTTVSTASGICHTVTATCRSRGRIETGLSVHGTTITHHQERKQLYLQHLVFVTPLLLPAAIVEELKLVWVCCAHSNQFQLFHDSGR